MKKCYKCNLIKELDNFNKRKSSKDGLNNWCKECVHKVDKEYRNTDSGKRSCVKRSKKYYDKNLDFCRELSRVNTLRVIENNRQFLNELKNIPCEICGHSFPAECMDFDHINPDEKSFEVSAALWKTMKRSKVEDELKKCRIICCYCHADITYASRPKNKNKYMRAKRERLDQLKNFPCAMCNKSYEPWKMQFDHLDGTDKIDCVSNMVAHASFDRVLEEIAKCQLLCIGCHRIITKKRAMSK